jgi:hypothetical protein
MPTAEKMAPEQGQRRDPGRSEARRAHARARVDGHHLHGG